MGVLGLWQILESVGHPIKIEGLEGKRLGVDANVWLYKFIRGFREKDNIGSLDGHKLGLFNRISKLLFYKIKPIFVFDGPAPVLKRRTLERRQNVRNKHIVKARDAALRLIAEQLQVQYPGADLNDVKISLPNLESNNLVAAEKFTEDDRDLFYLPPEDKESNDECDGIKPDVKPSVDIHSKEFESLPAEIRYEILQDIKESRRRIRRVNALPEDAGSFSNFQLERLRSRRMIQEKIEQCERDICSAWTGECDGQTFRMQSDPTTTMLYVKGKEHDASQSQQPVRLSSQEDAGLSTLERLQNVRNKHIVKARDAALRLFAEQSQVQYPGADLNDVKVSLPNLESNNLVAAEKFTEDDRDLFCLPPEDKESNDECDEIKPDVKPQEDASLSTLERRQNVRNKHIVKARDAALRLFAEQSQVQYPGADLNDVKVSLPNLESNNLVAAEKFTEDDRDLFCLPPEDKESNDECDGIKPDVKPQEDAGLSNPPQPNRANKVTSKIIEEAKELLRLFGVPYIDAAGEAEAQCALLEKLKLTEGTITDDSDVWLFGAQNVYRYFFSDDKYVMQYKMTDIEFHIRMTRENLVCFAMMVGSDYTDGIMNIGPVTALEVLSEFPGENMDPLIKFKNWKLKYESSKDKIPGSRKREKLLKFRLPEDFPSRAVFDGYMRPLADSSTEQFTWGTPELDELREYARRNFGWSINKIDEKLLPVMKRLSERKTQPTIDSFFFKTAANQNPELFRSKRVNQALNKMAKTISQKNIDEVVLTDETDDDSDKSGEVAGGSNSQARGNTKATRGKRTAARGGRKGPSTASTAARTKKNEPSDSDTNVTRKRRRVKSNK